MIHIRTDEENIKDVEVVETNPSYSVPTRPVQQSMMDTEMIDVIVDPIETSIPTHPTVIQSSQTHINEKLPTKLPITTTRDKSQQPKSQTTSTSTSSNNHNNQINNTPVQESYYEKIRNYCMKCYQYVFSNTKRRKFFCLTALYTILCIVVYFNISFIYKCLGMSTRDYERYTTGYTLLNLSIAISTFLWKEKLITSNWRYTIKYFLYTLILALLLALINQLTGYVLTILNISELIFLYNVFAAIFYFSLGGSVREENPLDDIDCIHLGCCACFNIWRDIRPPRRSLARFL